MVQTTGPLMSQEASGQLGRSVIFSPWKGKHRVKIYRKPKNPRSTNQQTNRGFMNEAVAAWKTLSDNEKLQWEEWK